MAIFNFLKMYNYINKQYKVQTIKNSIHMYHNKKILMNKLFPPPPGNRYNNLKIDMESISYITTPHNSDIISAIIDSQIPKHISRNDITIFDGTACVGGDTISFGRNFGTVIACEIDENRYKMLAHNLAEYKLYNVAPVHANCLRILQKINFIDIMYFDPPWGGRNYKNHSGLRLRIGEKYVDTIVNDIFSRNVRSEVKMVVFKLPKNYDIEQLFNLTKTPNITMMMYELKKMGLPERQAHN